MVKETNSRDTITKKKRKANPETEAEVDIYKSVVDSEEKEALKNSTDGDAEVYFATCNQIRKCLAEIAEEKRKCHSGENSIKTYELASDIYSSIVVLKRLNRMSKVRLVYDKELIAAEKLRVDSINLNYQNLLYESHHLVSEANKCMQFKSKDEVIELVPVEEFLSKAPTEVTTKFQNMKDNGASEHELRLARLEWELQERKNLSALCSSMKEQKTHVAKDIIELRKKLDGLGPKLNSVIESTKPLQEHLNIPADKIRTEYKLANLLPDPLYLFYVNIGAYKQVFDMSINVLITGDIDEAEHWRETNNDSTSEEEEQADSPDREMDVQEVEVDPEELKKSKKHRHSKSEQVNPVEEKKKKVIEVHPLSVEVTVPVKCGPILTMKFSYCSELEIVTTVSSVKIPEDVITANTAREVLTGDSLLSELVKGDLGLESPNPNGLFLLKKYDLGSYESLVPKLGYAYVWAQKVCGIDFLSKEKFKKNNSFKLSQISVESTMQAIQKRIETRFALAAHFQKLEKNIIPDLPPEANYPKNHVSSLTKFDSITYQEFCQSNPMLELLNEDVFHPNDLFYLAQISRGEATLLVKINLKNDFPLSAPIFSLNLKYNGSFDNTNSDEVRDMERAVNVNWSYGHSRAVWILSAQIIHLCSYLDVYLETKYPEAFQQSAMFFRNVCGRNRRRPFTFKKFGSGIFLQY